MIELSIRISRCLETEHFEPTEEEIGIGFHLEKPETSVYRLPPRGTATIPLSVIGSMWGYYNDILQLKVNPFFAFSDDLTNEIRSKVFIPSKKFLFEFKSLAIQSKHI